MAEIEIAPEAMSEWGRRLRQLQDWGWSIRSIAKAVGAEHHSTLHALLVDPNRQPFYNLGLRLRRLHVRESRRRRASK